MLHAKQNGTRKLSREILYKVVKKLPCPSEPCKYSVNLTVIMGKQFEHSVKHCHDLYSQLAKEWSGKNSGLPSFLQYTLNINCWICLISNIFSFSFALKLQG